MLHIKLMAKKNVKVLKTKEQTLQYRIFLIPAAIGGLIGWVVSGSLELGVIVVIAVLVGNWIGYSFLKKK